MPDLNNLFKQFLFYFDIRQLDTQELKNAPTGWRDMLVEYSRSTKYTGLLRNITGQLNFTKSAALILRREYAKYRLFARINMRILEDTRQPYNTYQQIYNGQFDFSKKSDGQNSFTVGAKSLDFSANIDAFDTVKYAIPIDDGINLELTPIALNETANLLPQLPPDGQIHADYFPPITVVNNVQSAIDASVQSVPYEQFRLPDFSAIPNWFFNCRLDGKLYITGNITFSVFSILSAGHTLRLSIVDDTGTRVLPIYDSVAPAGITNLSYTFNTVLNVTRNQKLFLYVQQVDAESSGTGILITGGEIDMSYQTATPPTMCKALTGTQLFAKLLQAMNFNIDISTPNLPVAWQSTLLSTILNNLVFTCSDSIRAAQGSLFFAGDTIGPGVYKVLIEPVNYNGTPYLVNQTFGFTELATTFMGAGVIQKIQSIFVGNVYNIGDTLQAGGTYLVEGITVGGTITYDAHIYNIGQIFPFVLGSSTFVGSDDTMFVKQIAIAPQIIISFSDFFQCIKSANGGDCAFGVDSYIAKSNTADEVNKARTGIAFIESLGYVYRSGINAVSLGNAPKDWKSTTAIDLMYNTIKVGNEDQQYDAINGTQEVASTQYYSTSSLNPVAELNLISSVRFDPYGIETVRITQNDSAASRSDNDVFGVWIKDLPESTTPFPYYHPLRSEGLLQPITGVDPSYYNYKLSPKSCLERGTRYLASVFYGMVGQQIVLSGYLKNIAMVYIGLDGVRIAEADPIQISNLGKPYFIPEYYTMTIPGGLIDANRYADMNFNVNGQNFKAFVSSYKCNFATRKPQEVKLLLSWDNDLSKTVR